jgi:hypothetical protein
VGDWRSGISRLIATNATGKQEYLTTVFLGKHSGEGLVVVAVTVPAIDSFVFRTVFLGEDSRKGLVMVTVTVPARDSFVFRTVFLGEDSREGLVMVTVTVPARDSFVFMSLREVTAFIYISVISLETLSVAQIT